MRTTVTIITDDIDGDPEADTHAITIDGQTYEVDLTEANFRKLREVLDPFIDAARRIRASNGTPAKRTAQPAATGYVTTHVPASVATIRAWWRSNPHGLPRWAANGRLPAAVVEAWQRHAAEPSTAGMSAYSAAALLREAEASVRLDGDTQSVEAGRHDGR